MGLLWKIPIRLLAIVACLALSIMPTFAQDLTPVATPLLAQNTPTDTTSINDALPNLPANGIPDQNDKTTQTSTSTPTSPLVPWNNNANNVPPQYGAPATGQLWNLQDVDIHDVIQEVSRETGKNFLIDPRVQGKITIVSSTPMTSRELYQVFLSTLNVLGYIAVPSGKVIKIVPDVQTAGAAGPVANGNVPGQGDEIVVRVIPVRNVSADQLVPVIRPLMPQTGSVNSFGPSNVLILAGPAANISRIAEIVNRVDTTNTNGIDLVSLRYASAQDVASTLQQLQETARAQGINQQISIAADASSNSILLSGNQQDRLKMKVLISQIDTPSSDSGNTQVIYLHYLRAQDLVPVLAGIAESYYRGPVGTVIGTHTQTGIDYSAVAQGAEPDESSNEVAPPPAPPPGQLLGQAQQALVTSVIPTDESDSKKPKLEIIAEPSTNAIILNAPPDLMAIMRSVIARLDLRPAQVLIEALIAEVDKDATAQLGIQWGQITGVNQTGITQNDAIAGFRQGIGIITSHGLHNFQWIMNALATDKNSNILSTPAVVVLDNHQAQITVGQEVSVQESSYPNNAGGTTGATPFETFARRKVALHLYVTPQIDQGQSLLLTIDQGNDTLENPENIQSTTTPVFNISSIKTSVLVNSGDILVLGGLTQDQMTQGGEGLPFLGDIPGLGALFKNYNHSHNNKQLMVFIRPVIVTNPETGLELTGERYNYLRDEQLAWLREQHFYHDYYNKQALPPLYTANIPGPFHQEYEYEPEQPELHH